MGTKKLKESGNEAPVFDAGALLCFALECDRMFLYVHTDYELTEEQLRRYRDCISERANRVPLQYITGRQEFMSLDFKVSPDVLIPRQDTETLVEAVLEYVRGDSAYLLCGKSSDRNMKPLEILDIGTGSGCIAVSLAHFLKSAHITAVDISQGALAVARENAVSNGVENRIEFVCADFLKWNEYAQLSGKNCNIIVSNPPYIPAGVIEELQTEVRDHEPRTALEGGDDGLLFYRMFAENIKDMLRPGGLIALEVGYDQAGQVVDLMKNAGLCTWTVKDIAGIDRVVMAVN